MNKILIFCLLVSLPGLSFAQTGFSCQSAINLPGTQSCSDFAKYNNADPAQNGITWFKFKAVLTVVTATASGVGTGGSLTSPSVKIFSDCPATNQLAQVNSLTANIGTVHAEGLTIGNTYYFAVTGTNLGTFTFCFYNYEPSHVDGEDCETAQFLYGLNDTKFSASLGPGKKNTEAAGTCMDGSEQRPTWIKWKAANNGYLVFSLIPDIQTHDLDFVLYDLGLSGDCNAIGPANALRCAAGSGVSCITGRYYKTGLSYDSQDLTETPGCVPGQDGAVKALQMINGHYYGLLVNNATTTGGFSLKFEDVLNGMKSDVQFAPPAVNIEYTTPNCAADRAYVFNNYLTTNNNFAYDFGQGATITAADGRNNFYVVYDSPGPRTVTLWLNGQLAAQKIIDVPASLIIIDPVIDPIKSSYCIGDTLILSTPQKNNNVYNWTGPNGFNATGSVVSIPITSAYKPGTYTVNASSANCPGGSASIRPNVSPSPQAAFSASPAPTVTLTSPATVNFLNNSSGAKSYAWDFGDGGVSTAMNPTHIYTKSGKFHVKMAAYNINGCSASVTEGDFIIKNDNIIVLYNSFTPNGDNVNDKFIVTITNLQKFHIQVFNRYGSLVFETRDQSVNWDGMANGSPAPVGAYYYIIDAVGLDGNVIKQSGEVSLLR